jgi:signal peptidase II
MPRRYKIFVAISLLAIVLDQLTKLWARQALTSLGFHGQSVIDGYWLWRLSYNTGSAFGLFNQYGAWGRVLLSLVGVLACGFIVAMLRKTADEQRWQTAALALVGGGAIGNVIDRVAFGKVTDFVVWRYGTFEWPAFNVADAALVVGVAILFVDGFKKKPAKST